jgi:predicted ATPase/class 3 adenylate cyclase
MARLELPTGTITFLFTDVEGSTRLLQEHGAGYADLLAAHRTALRGAFTRYDGVEVDTQGDAFFVAFARATDAAAAAAAGRQALSGGQIRVRMGIHTGEPQVADEGYVGIDVHRAARIAAAAHGGQIVLSATTRRLLQGEANVRDLGEHRLKDLVSPERLFQLGDGDFPPLRTLDATNLPIVSIPLVGRERELEEVVALLSNGTRLLTVTGPGGAGKTRLALQVAAELVGTLHDGVFWIPLTGLSDPELVPSEIARTVGAPDDLDGFLRGRELLILLDNFEHLLDAAPAVRALLESSGEVRMLVTSRTPLRVSAEHEYRLEPLPESDAATLFVQRARGVGRKLTADATVAQICRRLDGLPLAIELAAARTKLLAPERLLERLGSVLPVLTGGARDAPERQRTLRATIEWSYDLLDEEERLLFERLSVFRGGCMLEAAEEICDADIDTVQSLIDKSLLRRQGERFWMLETIREYAAEQLEQDGEAEVLAERHAQYFLAVAEEAGRGAPDGDVKKGRGLRHDLDNLRGALEWLIGAGEVERELRLATAAFWNLWTLASLRELKVWLVSALERASGVDSRLRAEALGATALAAANLGERDDAREYARESLALARERDDQRQIEWALRVLSFDEPDLDKRRRLLQECERLNRELGNDAGLGWVTYLLGWAFFDEGRFEEARVTFEQAAAIFTKLGKRWEATNAEIEIAYALIADGEYEPARPILEEALRTAVDLQSPALAVAALIAVGSLRVQTEPGAAARLLSAAWTIGEEGGQPLDPRLRGPVAETAERQARERLGERFEREWEAGSDLALEEAVALALDED